MFLHGSTTWSLTKAEENSLDGTYTRMLQMWKTYLGKTGLKKSELYCSLEKVTFTIQNRRIALSGHVFRDEMSQSSPAQC